jgi:hypothetical protein
MAKRTPAPERFQRYVVKSDSCWEWIGATNANGYGRFTVTSEPYRKEWAHRYAFELAQGRPLELGECVLHRCDNRVCVRPDHLFSGDRTINAADREAKGRTSRGEKHAAAVRAAWARRHGRHAQEATHAR